MTDTDKTSTPGTDVSDMPPPPPPVPLGGDDMPPPPPPVPLGDGSGEA